MKPPLLILDVHYLCHRAFHTTDLSFDGRATGVIYGFLKSIRTLKHFFQTDDIAFCFDSTTSLRKSHFPEYKSRRAHKDETPEKKRARTELSAQIDALRIKHLRTIGFRNLFYYPGYESDDIMASLSRNGEWNILITSDKDLYQCLGDGTQMFSPTQKGPPVTEKWFIKQYGIKPSQWPLIKAIAGCDTDDVPGIDGVGELTALKFVKGELKKDSKAYQSIMSNQGKWIIRRNQKLVQLPFEGCPTPKIQKDEIDANGWEVVCGNLGFKSLLSCAPVFKQSLLNL